MKIVQNEYVYVHVHVHFLETNNINIKYTKFTKRSVVLRYTAIVIFQCGDSNSISKHSDREVSFSLKFGIISDFQHNERDR